MPSWLWQVVEKITHFAKALGNFLFIALHGFGFEVDDLSLHVATDHDHVFGFKGDLRHAKALDQQVGRYLLSLVSFGRAGEFRTTEQGAAALAFIEQRNVFKVGRVKPDAVFDLHALGDIHGIKIRFLRFHATRFAN